MSDEHACLAWRPSGQFSEHAEGPDRTTSVAESAFSRRRVCLGWGTAYNLLRYERLLRHALGGGRSLLRFSHHFGI